jgi:hypothetical protein
MNMSATARRGVLATACLLVLPILSAAPAHGEPAPPPLPPAPGYPPPGLIVPGTSPPIQFGQPPVVGPLPPSTIDARGVDLSFTTDQSQPVLGMPGSRLGTPLTRIGIFGIDSRRRRQCRLYRLVKRSGRPPSQPDTQPASQPRINPIGATASDCWPHPVYQFQNAMNRRRRQLLSESTSQPGW